MDNDTDTDNFNHYYSDTSDDDDDDNDHYYYYPRHHPSSSFRPSDTASLLQTPFSLDASLDAAPLAGSRSQQTHDRDRCPAPAPRQRHHQHSRPPRHRPPPPPPARAYPARFRRSSFSSRTSPATLAVRHSPTPHTIDAYYMAGDKDAHSHDDIPLAAGPRDRGREWQQHQQRRPLIDMVTNEWQNNFHSDSDDDDDDDDFFYAEKRNWYTPAVITLLVQSSRRVPRRLQRTVCLGLGFLVAAWLGWRWLLQPYWHEQSSFAEAVSGSARWGVYGSNARPSFDDMVHVKQLDPSLLPGSAADNQRLVFVGDVHGCKDELVALLAKVNFHPASDHLILTGDMVSKGPDSPGVVDFARDMQASCVRGNHEDRVLLTHKSLKMALADANSSKTLSEDEVRNAGAQKDKNLARSLNGKQIEWLQQCPVILRVGTLPGMGQVVVAHAGLVPGIELERQDPYQVMNMRSVDLETKVPSEGRDYAPWDKYWNFFMSHVPNPDNRVTIVYGHDSKRGLNIRKHSRGIDSGCVRGGKLTALVVEADPKGGPVQQSIVSVKCKDYKNKDKAGEKKKRGTKGQVQLEEEDD